MARVHLFEFLDQSWLPGVLRNAGVAYLETMYRLNRAANEAFAAKLDEALRKHGAESIVDLCSGGSGPVLHLLPALREKQGRDVAVTLTDLYPAEDGRAKTEALKDPNVQYLDAPVDAREPPAHLDGMRTLFAGFHHLRPADAQAVLADAFHNRRGIAVFEATARKPALIIFSLLLPVLTLFFTLAVRPVRLGQLFFTYIIPVMPLIITWDGFVSNLRTYSVAQLEAMSANLQAPDYRWEIGELRIPGVPVGLPYLIGGPIQEPPGRQDDGSTPR